MQRYFVYVLQCSDGTFYTGIATDVARRAAEHNGENGSKKGAKYTRGRRPVQIVHSEPFNTRSGALRREAEIKKMPRKSKLALGGGGV